MLSPEELARAPQAVQQANSVLAEDAEKRTQRRLLNFLPLVPFCSAFPLARVLATVLGSEPLGALAIPVMWCVAMAAMMWTYRSYRQQVHEAQAVMQRWRELRAVGVDVDFTPLERAHSDPIARLGARILEVGADRTEIVQAAQAATGRAARLTAELEHLDALVQDGPDPVLEGARERIGAELAQIRGQLGELYASLLEISSSDRVGEGLEESVQRLSAELEVSRRPRRQTE